MIYFDHGHGSEETAQMHGRDAVTVIRRGLVKPGGYVLLDDHHAGGHVPKTKYSLPVFRDAGWRVVFEGSQVFVQAGA